MKFQYLNRLEKILVIFLTSLFFVAFALLFQNFLSASSEFQASSGGEYNEGLVGRIQLLNPVFSDLNPVDRDISSLIFSGLMKYNPKTGLIQDDLATHTLDISKKVYTFTLKDGVKWHDGTDISSDDVIFTFQEVIQNVDFLNKSLQLGFKGVEIKKIDDKRVSFTIEKPYKFFLTNLTVGLLPKHLLSDIPVANLHLSEFNTVSPVGSGPFYVQSISDLLDINAELVSLKSFDDFYGQKPYIDEFNFYVFPNVESMQDTRSILDGTQVLSTKDASLFFSSKQFEVNEFTFPQYVAIFFNTNSKYLKNTKTRLGLALGTNKEELLSEIKQTHKRDTPLLELDENNWIYKYDVEKAQGGLNDGGWKLPWKQEIEKTGLLKKEIAKKYITEPNNGDNYASSEKEYYIKGNIEETVDAVYVNNYKLSLFKSGDSSFAYKASLDIGTLKEGENIYKVEVEKNGQREFLDEIKIFYSEDEELIGSQSQLYSDQIQEEIDKIEAENAKIDELIKRSKEQPYRINDAGETLTLRLITMENNDEYQKIAEFLESEWEKLGVELISEYLSYEEFEQRASDGDYDIIIFGQNMEYNFDTYPYWHSSQTSQAYNFSKLSNFEIDTLLESVRSTHIEEKRQQELKKLASALSDEVPAIFLYSPAKYIPRSSKVQGDILENLRTPKDRFATYADWYVNQEMTIKDNLSISDFIVWLKSELAN